MVDSNNTNTLTHSRPRTAEVGLAHAVAQPHLRVVATLRADFLLQCAALPDLTPLVQVGTFVLAPPGPSALANMIRKPAERARLELQDGLADEILKDAGNDPGALPLIAFCLEELYRRTTFDHRLTLEAYNALGRLRGAISRRAAALLEELPDSDLDVMMPQIFQVLVHVDAGGTPTRRRAFQDDLDQSAPIPVILDKLVKGRLLTAEDAGGRATITLAHEALLLEWPELRDWLDKHGKALALRKQIEDAAAGWIAEKRSEMRREFVWPEARIVDAVRVIEDSGVSLAGVKDRSTVNAFLGPIELEELEQLPALGAAKDATAGSGRYGDAWRRALSHEARASIGVRLALRGDHREGVGLRADGLPDIAWRRIEGGEVTIEIRTDPGDPNPEVVDRLTRSVAPFYMARYPITIAHFRAFLRECYQNGHWRLPPGFFAEPSPASTPPKHRGRHGNQPADTVSWWDALLFCHWLSAGFRFMVRLPTEFEWQLAATGGDTTRTFPWGSDWDPEKEPSRANTAESGLHRSTAVGMYPAGASMAGVEDMAGTVWEWCLNKFKDPASNNGFPITADLRALRGGCWLYAQDDARSASRAGLDPNSRNYYAGFRVVCSSPS